jgi:hypothetical protein
MIYSRECKENTIYSSECKENMIYSSERASFLALRSSRHKQKQCRCV